MNTILVKNIRKNKSLTVVSLSVSNELKKYFNNTTFFTEYTFDISEIPDSILVVPVLTNLLPFSWLTDSIIWVNEIDSDFYNCIQELKTAFRELHPQKQVLGTLIAAKCVHNKKRKDNNSIQLFTGGIDATASY